MIYVAGTIGFVIGFLLGQGLLMVWLKDRSKEELLKDRDLRYRYGLFNWGLAAAGTWMGLEVYRMLGS
jgi:hypothetical protein